MGLLQLLCTVWPTSVTAEIKMADPAAVPKRRTFRKYSYRGVDLDQLLDYSREQMMEMYNARQRRAFLRGTKRKHNALLKRLRKAKKNAPPLENQVYRNDFRCLGHPDIHIIFI